jgi:hypothetical protein
MRNIRSLLGLVFLAILVWQIVSIVMYHQEMIDAVTCLRPSVLVGFLVMGFAPFYFFRKLRKFLF